MKKRMMIFIAIILLSSLFISAKSVVIILGGNYFSPSDGDFKDRYGDTKYFPEGKIALRLTGNIYLWGSLGFFSTHYNWEEWSNKGVIEADVAGEDELDKLIISGGLGYYFGFLRPHDFSLRFELGACRITNTIETTKSWIQSGEVVSVQEKKEAGLGFRGNLGLTYGLYKNFFAEVSVGYLYAVDKEEDNRIKLGGFRLALGLGIAF